MSDQMTGAKRSAAFGGVTMWGGVLAVGLVLALAAQFLLDSFADATTLGHWTQHALLFWSGLMIGAALIRLYQLGGRA